MDIRKTAVRKNISQKQEETLHLFFFLNRQPKNLKTIFLAHV
jgi:hypothetical protein